MNRPSILRRFCFVMLITGVIAVVLWATSFHNHSLDIQLVYSYAIATPIWFLTDIVRQRLFPNLPHQPWTYHGRVVLFIGVSIVLGYVLGTMVGDRYSGFSTFQLLEFAPKRFLGLIVLAVAISGAFVSFFYQQNKLHVVQQQATEAKLQLLQSQLEPHMLFNTLANLRVLIDLDSVRATAMLDRLIDYLRATLGASRVTSHALSLEFERLDDYLALMQVRMGQRLNYRLDLPDTLKATSCPALLLQPVVENAVLHGLEPSATGGEIIVSASLDDTPLGPQLVLVVTDTGIGFATTQDDASSESHSGFGLAQLRERLATLYGLRARIEIASVQPSGTQVTIYIPHSVGAHETNLCRYC